MESPIGGPRRDHWQPQPDKAVREETEVTSRFATEAELEALGYQGPVLVMQIVRTRFRADGTPIGKTLTVQGAGTPLVRHLGLGDEEAEAVLPPPLRRCRHPVARPGLYGRTSLALKAHR